MVSNVRSFFLGTRDRLWVYNQFSVSKTICFNVWRNSPNQAFVSRFNVGRKLEKRGNPRIKRYFHSIIKYAVGTLPPVCMILSSLTHIHHGMGRGRTGRRSNRISGNLSTLFPYFREIHGFAMLHSFAWMFHAAVPDVFSLPSLVREIFDASWC